MIANGRPFQAVAALFQSSHPFLAVAISFALVSVSLISEFVVCDKRMPYSLGTIRTPVGGIVLLGFFPPHCGLTPASN